MILLTLALTLAELPPQKLSPGQCAMFLWDRASRQRIVMWPTAQPLTIALATGPIPLTATPGTGSGTPVLGLLPKATFASPTLTAEIDLTIVPSAAGTTATIPEGILTLTAPDGEALITPVAGLIGCG